MDEDGEDDADEDAAGDKLCMANKFGNGVKLFGRCAVGLLAFKLSLRDTLPCMAND